jgi:hypothetical protein
LTAFDRFLISKPERQFCHALPDRFSSLSLSVNSFNYPAFSRRRIAFQHINRFPTY